MNFIHLHVHSHYSLLDGAANHVGLVKAAKELGMPALALTDHGNLFGAIKFMNACKAESIQPIIGMEAYIAPGSRFEKKKSASGAFFHQLLFARNLEGYFNLMKLSSLAYLEGFYYKPRIDKEILRQHSKGLIGTSSCLSGQINRAALTGSEEDVRREIEEYVDIFEPGCFFMEIQRHGIVEQDRILERIPTLAKEYGLPLLPTNDVHYLRRSDARAQEVHLCINTGQTLDATDRMSFDSDQFYFRSEPEMERSLGDFKDSFENTLQVMEMCTLHDELVEHKYFDTMHLPAYEIDDPEHAQLSIDEYFHKLCIEGCRERYSDFDENDELKQRLGYEIDIITRMGYPSYFLITWDFIKYARDHSIPVGPGRGSAAGSLIAYALKITNVDPLKYDLLFERFLNPNRVTMPDIDIDFCMDGREQVIEYVKRKYGEDHVCQIITFGTMAARAVIRDVGRALSVPLKEVDTIAKRIPAGPGVKLQSSIDDDKELQALSANDPKISELFDVALRLEGLNRHCSTHAAGVVIGDAPLIDTLPLYKNGEDITTQFAMEDLDAVGMLKMDFLGLRTLTVIDKARRVIRKTRGIDLDVDAIPLDDAATFELLCQGDTAAVFQLESSGMRDLLRRMKPDRFEDIIAILALYRPGPLEGGMVDRYIERKHGREPMEFDHPVLEPILAETNGVILYQEQVMRIANHMAGFNLAEADMLRRAMGKKKPEVMKKYEEKFVSGAKENKIDKKVAEHVFHLIEFFAGYGFNKSHSTAYALITFQTAYLKANYPTEFMAAVMSCEMNNTDKVVEYLEECRKMEIDVSPPSINHSDVEFSVEDRRIWYGLAAIKGVGGKVVDTIISDREASGEFSSVFDLCRRVDSKQGLNKSTIETLVSSGALDCFGRTRAQTVEVIDSAVSLGNQARKDRESGQLDLFDLLPTDSSSDNGNGAAADSEFTYPDVPEWDQKERLAREKKTLGFYLTGHPLDEWQSIVRKYTTHTLRDVAELPEGHDVVIAVQIAKITKKVSKRTNEPFWIALVEDRQAAQEIFVTQKDLEAAGDALHVGALVLLCAKVKYRDTTPGLRLGRLISIEQAPSKLTRDVGVVLPVDGEGDAEDLLFRIKEQLQNHHGKCPVFLIFTNQIGDRAVLRVGSENYVSPDADFLRSMDELCGQKRVLVNRMGQFSLQ